MTNPEKIKQILLSEIEKMNQHREDFCKHPGIDFTRDRKISFDTLLHFQISMESGSVKSAPHIFGLVSSVFGNFEKNFVKNRLDPQE